MIDLFELNTRPPERNAHHLANDIYLKEASLWRFTERRFFGRGQGEAFRQIGDNATVTRHGKHAGPGVIATED
jgi:hypothetical protein